MFIKRLKHKLYSPSKGFTLVELVVSLIFLSLVLVTSIKVFDPALKTTAHTQEYLHINLLTKRKAEELKAFGFWIWDVDTNAPVHTGNPYDPAERWKTQLSDIGFSNRGVINVVFQKEVTGNLEDFAGAEFDGNEPRNKVNIAVALYTQAGKGITHNIFLSVSPSEYKLKSILYILKKALNMYYQDQAPPAYPNSLDELVDSNYLAEIPNDPFTDEKNKITHKEELSDWYYVNSISSGNITLAANSHREDPDLILSWNY
jgi:hypothetical protein